MLQTNTPIAVAAGEVPAREKITTYPEPFASRIKNLQRRALGDFFGLENFGVNLTRLGPGGMSSLRHAHTTHDEFIYVLSGCPTLHMNEGARQLSPGMCVGFKAGTGNAHNLRNETEEDVMYLEIGDRLPDDEVSYPEDDLQVVRIGGKGIYAHKDGTMY